MYIICKQLNRPVLKSFKSKWHWPKFYIFFSGQAWFETLTSHSGWAEPGLKFLSLLRDGPGQD